MSKAFLANYSALLIKTCHNRAAFAMGGMAAQIPNRKDPEANELAFAKVRDDKEREARNGHDGTWVAHPDLVPVAMEVFNALMPTPNQLYVKRDDVKVGQKELLEVHKGTKTEAGLPREHSGRRSISRSLAAGARRRADLQSDGGCGDRRNLTVANLAMAEVRRHTRYGRQGHAEILRQMYARGNEAGEG